MNEEELLLKKLELAKLCIRLGELTRRKWERMARVKDELVEEEELIRLIAEKTKEIKE